MPSSRALRKPILVGAHDAESVAALHGGVGLIEAHERPLADVAAMGAAEEAPEELQGKGVAVHLLAGVS